MHILSEKQQKQKQKKKQQQNRHGEISVVLPGDL